MRRAMMLAALATNLGMAGAATPLPANAQVTTPPNCHWVSVPAQPDTIEMWCRADDGRARPTGRLMRQAPPDTWDGCARGRVYDGAHCVSESRALAEAAEVWASNPPPAPSAGPAPPASKPRILMFQDRKGRRGRGMACIDRDNVTICKPIPHY